MKAKILIEVNVIIKDKFRKMTPNPSDHGADWQDVIITPTQEDVIKAVKRQIDDLKPNSATDKYCPVEMMKGTIKEITIIPE